MYVDGSISYRHNEENYVFKCPLFISGTQIITLKVTKLYSAMHISKLSFETNVIYKLCVPSVSTKFGRFSWGANPGEKPRYRMENIIIVTIGADYNY